ncbi:hypothetical protein [Rhodopseudomonas palustris]|uniref:hypothetical protein n=1 Tax=Rhodopseudomonas palustris TaxID=1076 RepID=UPI001FDA925A|nr:hypothetical protein [Rhodopseudomonas palustris]
MLDTIATSHIIRGDKRGIIERLVALPISNVVISSISEIATRSQLRAKLRHGGNSHWLLLGVTHRKCKSAIWCIFLIYAHPRERQLSDRMMATGLTTGGGPSVASCRYWRNSRWSMSLRLTD